MIDPKAMEAARRIVSAHDAIKKAKGETHPSFKDAVQGFAYYEMHAANREGALTVAHALLAGEGNSVAAGAAPLMAGLESILHSAFDMLELIASRMPAGSAVRSAIEAECTAMRSAANAVVAKVTS